MNTRPENDTERRIPMSVARVAPSREHVKCEATPEVRSERKRKLQTMTPALYDELLANISRIMNPGFCDPGDALNEAISWP